MRSQWDNTQHGVEARLLQLDHMTTHSDQWQDQWARVKTLIGQNEVHLHNLLQMSREPLTKQIGDNKVRSSGYKGTRNTTHLNIRPHPQFLAQSSSDGVWNHVLSRSGPDISFKCCWMFNGTLKFGIMQTFETF